MDWLLRLLRKRTRSATMLTACGLEFDVLNPDPKMIRIEDIARGLANECRYSGQTSIELPPGRTFYGVAEHSVIVSLVTEDRAPSEHALEWAREALLHDASEAYIGDVIRPIKYLPEMRWYLRAEAKLMAAIHQRFGVYSTPDSRKLIKSFDNRILTDEVVTRYDPDGKRREYYPKKYGEALGVNIPCMSPWQSEQLFLSRFVELWPEYAESMS